MKKSLLQCAFCLAVWTLGITYPVAAQSQRAEDRASTSRASQVAPEDENLPAPAEQQQFDPALSSQPTQVGRTARSSAGEVGQRQTRDSAATQAGIAPMARIANRLQTRIQNRLRNRIDRNYDPLANANDPFRVAQDEAKTTGQSR